MAEYFISSEDAGNDLLAAAAFVGERISGADGRAEAMAAVVPGYLVRGDVDLAAELANTVDDPFSRDKLLMAVAVKCADIKDNEYAWQLADAIEDEGMRLQTLERIGFINANAGDIDAAEFAASQLPHPDHVQAAIAANIATSERQQAVEKVEGIVFPTARVLAYHRIAQADIDGDNYELAAEMLDRAAASADEIEHTEERVRCLIDTAQMYSGAKRNDLAVQTIAAAVEDAQTIENIHRDYFIGMCALGFVLAGSRDTAERTLDLVTDKTHMASSLLSFAKEDWRADDKENALDNLDEAYEILNSQKETETRDSRSRNTLWTSIAVQFAGFGKTERGLEIARDNIDPDEVLKAIGQIAEVLVIQNESDLAIETAVSSGEPIPSAHALIAVADELIKKDDSSKARYALDKAVEVVDGIPQISAHVDVLIAVAARIKHIGDETSAAAIADNGIKLITKINDESRRVTALAELSGVFDDIAQLSEASRHEIDELIYKATQ